MSRIDLHEIRQLIETGAHRDAAARLLVEVERLYAEEDLRNRAAARAALRGYGFWLSEAESDRMERYLATKQPLEHEKGVCRHCHGEGRIPGRSRCFGMDYDECPTCDGRRIDSHRVKVPREDVKCACPDWWSEHGHVIDWSGDKNPFNPEVPGLKHHENCPMRTA